jgi:hypothetical protein
VALITGGGSGLGAAIARKLHADGVAVVLADLPRSPGKDLAAQLGEGALFAPTDVTNTENVTPSTPPGSWARCGSSTAPQRRAVLGSTDRCPGGLPGGDRRQPGRHFNVPPRNGSWPQPVDGERGVAVPRRRWRPQGRSGKRRCGEQAGIVGLTICAARDLAGR